MLANKVLARRAFLFASLTGCVAQEVHDGAILAFDFDADCAHMVTGSLDQTAVLWDVKSLEVRGCNTTRPSVFSSLSLQLIKRYETNVPVRAVAISPYNDHIILAGGQDAKDVATKRRAPVCVVLRPLAHRLPRTLSGWAPTTPSLPCASSTRCSATSSAPSRAASPP